MIFAERALPHAIPKDRDSLPDRADLQADIQSVRRIPKRDMRLAYHYNVCPRFVPGEITLVSHAARFRLAIVTIGVNQRFLLRGQHDATPGIDVKCPLNDDNIVVIAMFVADDGDSGFHASCVSADLHQLICTEPP